MWQWGPVGVYGFGLSLGLIFVIATWAGATKAARSGMDRRTWWGLSTSMFAVAVIGARLVYMAPQWRNLLASPSLLWRPPIHGLSYFGGFFTALIFLALVAPRLRIPFGRLVDLYALPLAIGLVSSAVAFGAPIDAAVPFWLSVVLDVVYLTGVYVTLWRVWYVQRVRSDGAAFVLIVSGDALMRFLVGLPSITSDLHPSWFAHGTRAAVAVVGFALLSRMGRGMPHLSFQYPFYRPLSRWVGWLVAYGLLLAAMIVVTVS